MLDRKLYTHAKAEPPGGILLTNSGSCVQTYHSLFVWFEFNVVYDLTGGSWSLLTGGGVPVISGWRERGLGGEQGGGARGGD